jgi:hypothetical protein
MTDLIFIFCLLNRQFNDSFVQFRGEYMQWPVKIISSCCVGIVRDYGSMVRTGLEYGSTSKTFATKRSQDGSMIVSNA